MDVDTALIEKVPKPGKFTHKKILCKITQNVSRNTVKFLNFLLAA